MSLPSERRLAHRIGWALEVIALVMVWWLWDTIVTMILLFLTFCLAGGGAMLIWSARWRDKYDRENPYQPIDPEEEEEEST